jgi:23S rRNA pseudouridine2605 synthase
MAHDSEKNSGSPEGDRIAKVLARAGVASRRQAELFIVEGRVAVNGKRIDSPALNVTPSDRITVDGKPLPEAEPARLWLYHKPLGLVTTTRDDEGRPTVFDNLPEGLPRVVSVGRLDLNSEGLLLLTNDGALKRKLELPSTGWLRKYRVRVNGAPTDDMLAPLRNGIVVEGENFQPMIVAIDRQQGANAWLTIGIREGRNREIRRALSHVGLSVNRLIRISYGPFQLGTLAKGAVEEVKARVLREQLGQSPTTPMESDTPKPPRKQKPRPSGTRTDTPHKFQVPKGGPRKLAPRKDAPARPPTARPHQKPRPTRKP